MSKVQWPQWEICLPQKINLVMLILSKPMVICTFGMALYGTMWVILWDQLVHKVQQDPQVLLVQLDPKALLDHKAFKAFKALLDHRAQLALKAFKA
jgi:hypothetical protein